MSGENKTTKQLLKHVNNDFDAGLKYFKFALNNILTYLLQEQSQQVTVKSPINGFLLSELLKHTFSDILFDLVNREEIIFIFNNKYLQVTCNGEYIIFRNYDKNSDSRCN